MRVLKKAGNRETQGPGCPLSSQNLLEPGQRWGSCPSSTPPTAQPPHTPSSASLQPASPRFHPRPSLASVPDPEASLSLLSHSQPSLSSLLFYTGSSRELCQQPHAPQGRFPTPLAPTPPVSTAASGLGAGRRDEGTCCSSFCPPSWLEAIKGPDFSLCFGPCQARPSPGPRGDEQ